MPLAVRLASILARSSSLNSGISSKAPSTSASVSAAGSGPGRWTLSVTVSGSTALELNGVALTVAPVQYVTTGSIAPAATNSERFSRPRRRSVSGRPGTRPPPRAAPACVGSRPGPRRPTEAEIGRQIVQRPRSGRLEKPARLERGPVRVGRPGQHPPLPLGLGGGSGDGVDQGEAGDREQLDDVG